MISQETIDKVLEAADVVEVIGRHVDLKKKGVNYTACCPFHDEKTSSFVVSQAKNVYKCFGCGKSGRALNFVMEYEGKTFPEAIEILAEQYKIAVDKTVVVKSPEKLKEEELMAQVMTVASMKFIKNREADVFKKYAERRGLTEDMILNWGIGWSGSDYKQLTGEFLPSGRFDIALKAGLVVSKVDGEGNNKNYDVYVNRMTIPIYDNRGLLAGYGGRYVGDDERQAKYINPKESGLYNKSEILFGLDKALKHIVKTKTAVLTEGYLDVISMHENGCPVTVATCGTSLTDKQASRLAKLAENVIIMYDNDKAGKTATLKAAQLLMTKKVNVTVMDCGTDRDGKFMDPDDYARSFEAEVNDVTGETESLYDRLVTSANDAIWWAWMEYCADVKPDDVDKLETGIDNVCKLLSLKSEFKRQYYLKELAKKTKVPVGVLKDKCTEFSGERAKRDNDENIPEGIRLLPKGANEKEFMELGLTGFVDTKTPERSGYYFRTRDGFMKVGNFVIEPLYHVYGEDNYRMVRINNGRTKVPLLVSSKDMVSMDGFEKVVFNEGNFVFENGTKLHLQRINTIIGEKFPLCYIIEKLGQQPEGFFAWSNYVYNGELIPYTELGIVQHKDKNYLSPSIAGKTSKHRQVDDQYENDRYLEYKEPTITFSQWMDLFMKVYPDQGISGIAFALVSLFKDIVQNSTKVPLLYAYGKVESGKSEYAESITYLFFSGKDSQGHLMKPFNLNQGTEFAFFNLLERYMNMPVALNEFDENSIDELRFRALKGIYDGEGRQKGSGIKNKSKSQKILCTVILMGQYLSTKDDNSVLSRGIPESFKKRQFTTEDSANHKRLKDLELAGLSGIIVEMLKYRKEIKEFYGEEYGKCLTELKEYFIKANKKVSNRMTANCTALYAMLKLAQRYWTLPFTIGQARERFINLIDQMNDMMQTSDSLSDFWSFTEYLLERGEVVYNRDLKVEAHTKVLLSGKDGDFEKTFKVKRLLFLRVGPVHKSYESSYRRHRGKAALNQQTIMKYLQEADSYIGMCPKSDFYDEHNNRKRTSCMVFDYELFTVNLEMGEKDLVTQVTLEGIWIDDQKIIEKLGENMVSNRLKTGSDTAPVMYKCFTRNMDTVMEKGTKVKITGELKEMSFKADNGTMVKYNHVYNVVVVGDLPF